MKPWREVLAERGWELPATGEAHKPANKGWMWTLRVQGAEGGVWVSSLLYEQLCGPCVRHAVAEGADADAAFTALMAKPIGPGRVTVGVLLGVV